MTVFLFVTYKPYVEILYITEFATMKHIEILPSKLSLQNVLNILNYRKKHICQEDKYYKKIISKLNYALTFF